MKEHDQKGEDADLEERQKLVGALKSALAALAFLIVFGLGVAILREAWRWF